MSENQTNGSVPYNSTWQEIPPAGTDAGQLSGAPAGLYVMPQPQKEETEYTKKLKGGFGFFGLTSFLYACFYAFCMFRNPSGITYPFFVAGGLAFFYSALSKLGISWKKGSAFYMVSIMLLAVSTFCTDDNRIIAMNKVGIVLLLLSLLLGQMYDTSKWKLGKYLSSILLAIFASIGEVGRPFADAGNFCKTLNKKKSKNAVFVIAGLGIAAPVFVIVFLLLASADAVFREMSNRLLLMLNLPDLLTVCFMAAFMFFAVYCILSYLCKKTISEEVKEHKRGEPILVITVNGMLTVLYLVFSVIQILYLFLGNMQLPAGYTYAEYAREGFFQLLAVSVLNLVIVLVSMEYFKESKVLKAVLTAMSACTFIMILSSAMRMIIYIQYYYLTFLRIFVLWSLAVLFLLFIGVVINIFHGRFPLFRYGCIVVTCCYLLLSFAHPDYWIAKVNVGNIVGYETESDKTSTTSDDFFRGSGYQDYYFLSHLSADAAPVLMPYLQEQGGEINGQISYYIGRMQEKEKQSSLLRFNVSRFVAFQYLDGIDGNK